MQLSAWDFPSLAMGLQVCLIYEYLVYEFPDKVNTEIELFMEMLK